MSFLNVSLAAMSLILFATAAVIVFLYWLKPPPRRVMVPSMLIWGLVLKERKRRSDFWRWLVSMLIALATGLAIAAAIGRPEIEAISGTSRRIAVVVDNSPTMGATNASGETRWDRALDEARALLAQGSSGSEFLLTDTAGQAPGGDFMSRRVALERLDRLGLSYSAKTSFPPQELFGDAEVYFVTDGVLVTEVPDDVQVVSVFEPVPNVAITAFDVRPVPANPARYEAFLEIANHGSQSRRVGLQIDGAGGASIQRAVSLGPEEAMGDTLDLAAFASGPVRALIDAEEDGFDLDDVAYAYLGTPKTLDVALVTSTESFLQTVLELDPRVRLQVATPADLPLETTPDVYVFERFAPATAPDAAAILFNPPAVSWMAAQTGRELTGLSLQGTERDHPLMDHVSLADVNVERVRAVEADDFTVVAGTPLEPLVLAGSSPVRFVHVTFDLAESNFPFQASFPIFLSNALDWLTGTNVRNAPLGTIAVDLEGAQVTDLEGRDVPVRTSGDKTSFVPGAPGLYSARGATGELVVSANLLDPRISDVNASVLAGSETAFAAGSTITAGGSSSELWTLLLIAALILVLVEWWTFHRRMTV